jgi:hypothetical protein
VAFFYRKWPFSFGLRQTYSYVLTKKGLIDLTSVILRAKDAS